MELVWRSASPVSVREVREALPAPLAYTTVMTTLDRLYKKGLLVRVRERRAYRYSAGESREAFAAGLLRRSLDLLLSREGARPVLSTLVDAVGDRDRDLLPELERLVREKERSLREKPQ